MIKNHERYNSIICLFFSSHFLLKKMPKNSKYDQNFIKVPNYNNWLTFIFNFRTIGEILTFLPKCPYQLPLWGGGPNKQFPPTKNFKKVENFNTKSPGCPGPHIGRPRTWSKAEKGPFFRVLLYVVPQFTHIHFSQVGRG